MTDTSAPTPRCAGRPRRAEPPRRPPAWTLPWQDRMGRFSTLRLSLLIALATPACVLLAMLASGGLGGEPWKQATRQMGSHAAHILLISLAVTPLRHIADWPKVATLRRMIGLAALCYALLHLTLYSGHLAWDLLAVAGEIASRFYLTLGFAVLVGLCVLGWTSTDRWQARLGRGWGRLHRWVYLLAAGAVLHAFLQSRGSPDAATVMAGCFAWLMLWRLLPGAWRAHPPALLGLAAAAALATAAIEYAWCALATRIPPERILAANLDLVAGLRPAQGILLAGLAVALLPWVLGWLRRRVRKTEAAPQRA